MATIMIHQTDNAWVSATIYRDEDGTWAGQCDICLTPVSEMASHPSNTLDVIASVSMHIDDHPIKDF